MDRRRVEGGWSRRSLSRSSFSALRSPLSALRSPLSALRSLLFALCSLLSALCPLLSALCSLLSALCSLLFALCSLHFALCSLLFASVFWLLTFLQLLLRAGARAFHGAPGERREAVDQPEGLAAGMRQRFSTGQGRPVRKPRSPHANPERRDARRARTRGGLSLAYFS